MNLTGIEEAYLNYRHGYPPELLRRLVQYQIGTKGQHVLDVGTANGLFARDLARNGCRVTGVDLSEEMIRQAEFINKTDQLPINYMVENVEQLPFDNSAYEAITAVFCWHWFDKKKAAAEILRVLSGGGKLAVVHYDWLPDRSEVSGLTSRMISKVHGHVNQKHETNMFPEWVQDFYDSGFSNVETFSFDVNISYTIDSWIGRVEASPEIGGSLSIKKVKEFNNELKKVIEKTGKNQFDISYRAFCVVAEK
ncbi:class I SAM-dependent methyltransferase [Jeotgalibacillus malaysiensis]|uniref:class I SAM-dependent methyltransferase n=1 Tax=Jeotgalibacillus malaysiensis TaxID=1508404 RepID=UPI00384ECB59